VKQPLLSYFAGGSVLTSGVEYEVKFAEGDMIVFARYARVGAAAEAAATGPNG
jgi:hypothetical protein